jgi:hypothetical protein
MSSDRHVSYICTELGNMNEIWLNFVEFLKNLYSHVRHVYILTCLDTHQTDICMLVEFCTELT